MTPSGAGGSPGPKTDWDAAARWYDELVGQGGSEYHREVVFPGVLRLLGELKGRDVLDLACGQGVLCRLLYQQGARVTGVDASGRLLEMARLRSDPAIRYVKADARDLSGLEAEAYDAATCVLAIQNIQPVPPVFSSAARCLRPGGRLVVAMTHPAFRGPRYTSWGWDGAAGVQYRRVDRYLLPRKEPIVTHPGAGTGEYTWTFHRPIQAYFRALRQAGLLVDALEEWPSHKVSDSGPRAAAENAARKEIPLFLALRAIKVGVA